MTPGYWMINFLYKLQYMSSGFAETILRIKCVSEKYFSRTFHGIEII